MKEGKLKGDDFFAVKKHPQITFRSTGMTSTGPDQYRIEGEFTIRGVSRKETLNLTVKRDQPNEGRIQGQMAFDRREYGMTHGIPFIKIADRVEVNVDLHARRVSGPPIQPK
jgi:polyisoprenoid-binding protein YceI